MSEDINTGNCDSCIYKSILFEGLSSEELRIINHNKTVRIFSKGEYICHEGDEIKRFICLKEGLVKLYREGKSRHEHIISIARPMDFIGLLGIFSNSNYLYSIVAIEDSDLCLIDLESIKSIIKSNGTFALNILEKMSSVSDQVLQIQIDLAGKQLRGRIAYIILLFANQIYKTNRFDLPISRKEIGDLIEMRTENVIRILSEFRKDKLLKIEGKTIEVLDMELMKKISELG
ncbi:MAG: Crp/Fnr family transcriptional regulator [Bacteroidales bacterium]|nr:MAG: Crp/Fnr family transcriptional regulator [Bacteroidales bacterium]